MKLIENDTVVWLNKCQIYILISTALFQCYTYTFLLEIQSKEKKLLFLDWNQ